MRIGGNASYVIDVTTPTELHQAYLQAKQSNLPTYMVGGGSNLIAHDEGFPGVIVHNMIGGISILDEQTEYVTIKAGSGVIWDDLVKFSVLHNLTGIEAMSGIPGTVGAAPVQNIGAYGQELGDTFLSLEAYDIEQDKFVTLEIEACKFSYRSSIFRTTHVGRYAICSVTLSLLKRAPEPPFYDSLQKRFDELNITEYTAQAVRDNVLGIRKSKLPDPAVLPNSGSFFKNPIVDLWKADEIRKENPDLITFPVDEHHVKIPAGWLIENAEFKGKVLSGIKVHDGNAVVLINQSATSYAELAAAREEIVNTIRDMFQIILEQEPLELLPPKT